MKNNFLESSYKAVNWILQWGNDNHQKGTICEYVNSIKVQSRFQVFPVIMQVKSNIIFEVMFYIDED